jgi:hypothetical protein
MPDTPVSLKWRARLTHRFIQMLDYRILGVCCGGERVNVPSRLGEQFAMGNPVGEAAWLGALDLQTLRTEGRAAAGRGHADYLWDRCAGALEAALHAGFAGDRTVVTRPEPVT